MHAELYDLEQFFKFCQLHSCLNSIVEQHHPLLYADSIPFLTKSKEILVQSLKKDSPLTQFCNQYRLKVIDLDLLNIAVSVQKRIVTLDDYLEKSILEPYDTSIRHHVLKKLQRSQLIKKNYLALELPFQDAVADKTTPSKELSQNKILELLNSDGARKRSTKNCILEFSTEPYERFDSLLQDMYFLDKILHTSIDTSKGVSKENVTLLHSLQVRRMQTRYEKTLKQANKDFSMFLVEQNIQLNEALLLLKYLLRRGEYSQLAVQLSDEVFAYFRDEHSLPKLLKNKLLTKSWRWFELTPKAVKGLCAIEPDDEDDDIVCIEEPTQTLDTVCLSKDVKKQILNSIDQCKHKDLVFNQWGLGESIGYGKGITLNFSGPPGTGKTLSVRAIANYLGKKLLTINYGQIESMWVGGTEKNIREAFKKAKKEDAVLFFDEADSLTTKRENARASWEITRTNTLLKELEDFDGICIFATNFAENYDEAFNRRLSAHIQFTLPDTEQLQHILDIHFPKKEALAKDIDFSGIAKKYTGMFSGGDVKNIVLNAARMAASDETNTARLIWQQHIVEACNLVANSKEQTMRTPTEELSYFG